MSMARLLRPTLCLLLSMTVCRPSCSEQCHPRGPASCLFRPSTSARGQPQPDWCGWSPESGWAMDMYDAYNFMDGQLYLPQSETLGRVVSRLSCPTGPIAFCVTFQYWLDVRGAAEVSLLLRDASDGRETSVWRARSSAGWSKAVVAYRTRGPYRAVLQARRLTRQRSQVLVDTLRPYPCPDKAALWTPPPRSRPPSTTASSAIATETSSTLSTPGRQSSVAGSARDSQRLTSPAASSQEVMYSLLTPGSATRAEETEAVTEEDEPSVAVVAALDAALFLLHAVVAALLPL